MTPIDELLGDRILKNGEEGCWEWAGATTKAGYPEVKFNGETKYVHRMAARRAGADVHDKVVRHSCDNPRCVNPRHLQVGSHSENQKDSCRRDGDREGVELTPNDVEEIQMKYDTTEATQAELADEYGTSRSNIGRVTRRETWS